MAAATLAFLIFTRVLFPAPAAILFLGAVLGSLSALTAIGIVLVYRANRIINFAQGDLGALAAILGVSLIAGWGWGFFSSFAVGLVAAAIVGFVVERVFVRRFARAPRLILTVATIGISLLCQAGQLALPLAFGYDTPPQNFPTPFSGVRFTWEPVVFGGQHLFALLVVPLVAAGVGVLLRRTRYGKAIRASAESSDRALLLGIPVRRLNVIVWVSAAVLSAITAELRTPIVGVAIGTVLGPALLLRALAAAVIGRMENLGVTFAAAVLLGMIEQSVYYATGTTGVVDAVLLVVVIAALLVRGGGGTSRADERGAASWTAVAEVRPVPPEIRHLPEIAYGRAAVAALLFVAFAVAPLAMEPGRVYLLSSGLILALTGISLVVLTGWGGQISLGQMAFLGIAGAAAGSLAQHGWHFFLTLAVAGAVGVGAAVAVGLPALRIRGPFLAVGTFAFALATASFVLNEQYFPWLVPNGRIDRPVLFGKFDLESEHAWYYVVLIVFVLAVLSARSFRRSRPGRALVASRENERAAQSFSVNVTASRLAGFAYSGFIAAIAGALLVYQQHALDLSPYRPEQSINVFAMAVFGGLGGIAGVSAGAAWFTGLETNVGLASLRILASGVGLLAVLLVLPGGLTQVIYGGRDAMLRVIARRRGLAVPSLTADAVSGSSAELRRDGVHNADTSGPGFLSVRAVELAYGKAQVLFGVDLEVAAGEIVALLGTNGAGKSTLLNAIAGLLRPTSGTIHLGGDDITGAPADALAAAGIAVVPGGKGIFPTLTVAEHIDLAGWLIGDPGERRARADAALEYFPRLRERWDQKAGNLSGGEQQMLALVMAFMARPRLLLIDELSLGLAPVVVEQLLGIVRDIHAGGTTVVLVEQSVNVAITLAERAVFMEKGEVRFDGRTGDLLHRPDVMRAVFLDSAAGRNGSAQPFVARCDACGHEHGVALQTRGVTVGFGGIHALTDVDITARAGQIVGLIGPNGAGKTTFLDAVSGTVPSSGAVLLDGTDVTMLPPHARAAAGLGRSFQDARLFPAMTVAETIAVALERWVRTKDPVAAALASPATRVSERVVTDRVDELIELMRLGAYANKFVSELSTGTRRMVDLACVLAHKPSVLLLDEPSSGIAQREAEALGPVLLDIRDRTGAAVVIIEHDMPLITSIADELVALETGRVIARGAPDDVIADPAVVASYLGTSDAAFNRSGSRRRRRRRPVPT